MFAPGNPKMILKKRACLLLWLTAGFAYGLKAQVYDIRGVVCTKGSNNRIAQAMITNKKSLRYVLSDGLGMFAIKANAGDTIEITKIDFTSVQQVVDGPANMVVFMQPVVHLDQVKIIGQSKQQELSGYMEDYRKKGIYNNGKTSVAGAVFHPLNALYDLFGKGPGQARRFAEMTRQEVNAAEDRRRFNKDVVKRITGLSDDEAQKFVDAYAPDHDDLKKWNDYDLIDYIKKSLTNYNKYGAQPLQKLY
mgnify:CR=1 FL=1